MPSQQLAGKVTSPTARWQLWGGQQSLHCGGPGGVSLLSQAGTEGGGSCFWGRGRAGSSSWQGGVCRAALVAAKAPVKGGPRPCTDNPRVVDPCGRAKPS